MIEKLRWRLAVHFCVLSFLTAVLIGMGSNSFRLAGIVFLTVTVSLIFVDGLGWFSLHKYLAYAGMVGGAVLALSDFFRERSSNQLYAMATLLIYAQIVLLLQRKNRRIFEQLGIFLLLELIVAALVNDNVLFGVLLLPILALGLSTFMLFTYYVAIGMEGKNAQKDRFDWQTFLQSLLPSSANRKKSTLKEEIHLTPLGDANWRRETSGLRWVGQLVPMGMTTLLLACLFFYVLPRTNRSSYNAPSWIQPIVGFSDTVALDQFGEILRSEQLVMRVNFRDLKTNRSYTLQEAPYIRGVALEDYDGTRGTGIWKQRNQVVQIVPQKLPVQSSLREEQQKLGDFVSVRFAMEPTSTRSLFCVSPCFALPTEPFQVDFVPEDWRVYNINETKDGNRKKVSFSIGTNQYRNGRQTLISPDPEVYFDDAFVQTANIRPLEKTRTRSIALTRIETKRFPSLIALTEKILKQNGVDPSSKIAEAMALENFLATGQEFTYSLDLSGKRDVTLDSIEDFVVNQKSGHCQYFAATLAMMLRSRGIPARLIVGYRPSEYNELGDYFMVRQQDAHTWVEAYFTAEQFESSNLFPDYLPGRGGWLRLDPTPATELSNSGGQLRRQQGVPDFFQEIWNRNVLQMSQLSQDGNLYDPLSDSGGPGILSAIRLVQLWMIRAQEEDFAAGMLAPSAAFSMPIALWLIGIGALIAIGWWFLGSRLARFFSCGWFGQVSRTKQGRISVAFYQRCIGLLSRVGLRRKPWQTPREITQSAGTWFEKERGSKEAAGWLSKLTDAYYEMRFGGVEALPATRMQELETHMTDLEKLAKR